ncbi:MAG TPA: outer membrane beta-barrel protein [Chitinophagaceae bacterium]
MKRPILLLLLLAVVYGGAAQTKARGMIAGTVLDARTRLPLPDATITLLNKRDSSSLAFAIVDKQGHYELQRLEQGSYLISLSYIGYIDVIKPVSVTASDLNIDMGAVYLVRDTGLLQGVTIIAQPITISNDTIQFKASAFKTRINATLEDLLKKIPGMEIDKDGNISSLGEPITKIYVDGKEFFSNDPKLASKNLTADLVESVQVFDDMSDQARFTKIDDGSRQRAINIKLKKDRKKGQFGRVNVGAGTSDRYAANVSANSFNNKSQVSILGGANNVNRLGFTSSDAAGGAGAAGGAPAAAGPTLRAAAPDGNTQSWNAGINYRDIWTPKLLFSGNYFVANTSTINNTSSYTQNFFNNDSASYTTTGAYNKNTNLSHRVNMRVEYIIDSANSFLFIPFFSTQNGKSSGYDSISTRSDSAGNSYTAITGNTTQSNAREGWNLGDNLLYRHRFNKPGRTLTIGWNTLLNHSNSEGYNTSPYRFYNKDGSLNYLQNLQQQNLQNSNGFNNTISTSFTELIGTNKILEFNYAYANNQSNSDRKTNDYSAVSGKYDSVNKPLTNYFENGLITSRPGLNFRVKNQKYDFQLGGAVQFSTLENLSRRAIYTKDSLMTQHYTDFFPMASFNYTPSNRKSLRFNYRGSTRAPTIAQLQDVPDVSNPLNYVTGNPALRQEFDHNFNMSYNTFNVNNFLFLNAGLNGSVMTNKIVNSIDSLGNSILITRPVNLNGAYNLGLSGTLGIPLKKVASGKRSPMNLNLTSSLRYARDVGLLYKQLNYSSTVTASQRVNYNLNVQDRLDIIADINVSYNNAAYTVQSAQSSQYFLQNYALDLTYQFFKRLTLSTDFNYAINSGLSSGFNQHVPLWNGSIAVLLFKKKNGELRVSVYDILNQNKSITHSTGDGYYIKDTYTQVLQRFSLLSFMYNLNHFAHK